MTPGYIEVIRAADKLRRDLFQQATRRMGVPAANVEKDFWVCLALDALFNWPMEGGARLLFKGGTSLAKAYGLVSRFSEDIDVTVFREDLGVAGEAVEIEQLSGNKRKRRMEAMKEACQRYIVDRLIPHLRDEVMAATFEQAGRKDLAWTVTLDPAEDQTILFAYPSVIGDLGDDGYVRRVVKIEMGAKSAMTPNRAVTVKPFIAEEAGGLPLEVAGVTTLLPTRTFWDKVHIAHDNRERYDLSGQMLGDGQRLSRHYYDLHRLLESEVGDQALEDRELGADCLRHRRVFFPGRKGERATAGPGGYRLVPEGEMVEQLRRDYDRMRGMIFGEAPAFDAVMASIEAIERRVNERS